MTAKRILKKAGCKAYHKYKTQKLSELHKINRVSSAEKLLRQYGAQYRAGRSWSKLINTDFSAKIKVSPTRKSKNDIVWSTSRGTGFHRFDRMYISDVTIKHQSVTLVTD